MKMQGFRNYSFEQPQRGQPIVVDILPSQYTKPSTPPPSPTYKGEFTKFNCILFSFFFAIKFSNWKTRLVFCQREKFALPPLEQLSFDIC